MSDSKTPTRPAKDKRRAPRGGSEAVPPASPLTKADRIAGRHAAITNNLNDWRSYKIWAENIRGTWEEKK
jgi:hypothetical protein